MGQSLSLQDIGVREIYPRVIERMPLNRLIARGVRRCLGGFVPSSSKLAFNYALAKLQGCEPELRFLERIGPNRGLAIDAGANEGLYTHRLSRLYEHVHAFEIHPGLAQTLQRYAPSQVTVHAVGLSAASSDERVLMVPVYRGRPLYGWASLEPGNCPGAEQCQEVKSATRTLDSFGLTGVTFIKADVEGHELDLLAGARQTIASNRPVVLLEVKAANVEKVQEFFKAFGYHEASITDRIGVEKTEENYLFEPV